LFHYIFNNNNKTKTNTVYFTKFLLHANMQAPSNRKGSHSSQPVLFPPLNDDDGMLPQQLQENFSRICQRKRRADGSADNEEMQQLAVETAWMVENEVKRMKASIAELEQLLVEQQQQESVPVVVDDAALPRQVVVIRDEEDHDDARGNHHPLLDAVDADASLVISPTTPTED
jgi:hypothetical protein